MKNVFEIIGGKRLNGVIINQTSKNATLPIMSAGIICKGKVKINKWPDIVDFHNMCDILIKMGAEIEIQGRDCIINYENVSDKCIDCDLSKTMRSSQFLLGSTLARFKSSMIVMPGGCKIGARPLDIHINAFKKLNVKVVELGDRIFFDARNAKPNKIKLRIPSVGATENIVQFASTLKGKTIILNSAKEPEVVDLCNFLNKMGAKILGAGTDKITIYGVDSLHGVDYTPIGDRIVAGTIAVATALCGGDVTIYNAFPYQNLKLIEKLRSMSCQVDIKNDIMHIVAKGSLKSFRELTTGFYPDFPTDLQSMLLTLSCLADGETIINEKVFENRFLIVDELNKLGANIEKMNNHQVRIRGVKELKGGNIVANDLRGGASLVLAGMVAKGKTTIANTHYIDRGYEHIEEIFSSLGAKIKRK